MRAQFYNASGANIGYQEACAGSSISATWQEQGCYFIAPGNAASMKVQLWLVQASGWVAFDDITLASKSGVGVGSYYYFGGQRIALFTEEGLQYIHTDHLNSTTLLTDDEGNAIDNGAPRFYAYGREGDPNGFRSLPTEHGFTGQRHDSLTAPRGHPIYMNARYYDPELGSFISPDTIVPDAANVMDYNRYMFVRGNPLKYNDPTGHCATLENGSPDLDNDAGCWNAADEWFATFGSAGYENVEDWSKYFASNASITEDVLRGGLYNYWHPIFQQSGIYHPLYNPPPQMNEGPPLLKNSPDAIVLGVGIAGTFPLVGPLGISYGPSLELYLNHKTSEIAIYESNSGGPGIGAGGAFRIYKVHLYNSPNARSYAGPATATDYTLGPLVAGTVTTTPGGSYGDYYGVAVGAQLSVSKVGQYAPPAYLIVNLADGTVSSPQLELRFKQD